MLVSGIFGRKNLYSVDVALELPREIFAGKDTPVVVQLVNRRKRMPAFLIKVRIEEQEVLFPVLPSSSSDMRHVSLRFEKRGRYTLSEVYVSSVFPFNFFTRFRKIAVEQPVIVFPMPVRCRLLDTYNRQVRSKGEKPSSSVGFESDIISIRDYVSGDPPKYIAWKSTAKTGLLKTKEYSSIQTQYVMIDFDKLDKSNLEYTLSCIAFEIVRLIKANTPVGLAVEGEVLRPGISSAHKVRMLTKLALYGQH